MTTQRGQLARKYRRRAQSAVRNAAAKIMTELSERGPTYSGDFANSWVCDAPGVAQGPASGAPYTLRRSIPQLPDTVAATNKPIKLVIYNTADHADIAMDLEPGKFINPGFDPIKDPVSVGRRVGKLRGEVVDGEGDSISTAERDWFLNYVEGGETSQAMQDGIRIAFTREV